MKVRLRPNADFVDPPTFVEGATMDTDPVDAGSTPALFSEPGSMNASPSPARPPNHPQVTLPPPQDPQSKMGSHLPHFGRHLSL